MKLAVASLLPDKIAIRDPEKGVELDQEILLPGGPIAVWRDTAKKVADREWLHVCWLAERTLTREECHEYHDALRNLETAPLCRECHEGKRPWAERWTFNVGWEFKIEHICRVRFPEMFTTPAP